MAVNQLANSPYRSWWIGYRPALLLILAVALQSCAIPSGVDASNGRAGHNSASSRQSQQLFFDINLADAAYQAGRWKEASRHYRGVLEKMPQDPYAWFRLGNSLTRQGHYSHAIQAFEASLQHDARQAKPWFNLSTAHLLGAQLATLKAWEVMAQDDPSRQVIQRRLDALSHLLQ